MNITEVLDKKIDESKQGEKFIFRSKSERKQKDVYRKLWLSDEFFR